MKFRLLIVVVLASLAVADGVSAKKLADAADAAAGSEARKKQEFAECLCAMIGCLPEAEQTEGNTQKKANNFCVLDESDAQECLENMYRESYPRASAAAIAKAAAAKVEAGGAVANGPKTARKVRVIWTDAEKKKWENSWRKKVMMNDEISDILIMRHDPLLKGSPGVFPGFPKAQGAITAALPHYVDIKSHLKDLALLASKRPAGGSADHTATTEEVKKNLKATLARLCTSMKEIDKLPATNKYREGLNKCKDDGNEALGKC